MVGYDLSNVAADAGAPSLGARKPSPAGVGIKTPPTNGSSHDINQAVPARNQKEAGVLLGKKAAPWVVAVLPSPAEQRKHQRKHNHQPPPAPSSRLLFFPWGGAGPSCCQAWVMPLAYQGIELFVVSLPGRGGRLLEPPEGNMSKVVQAVMGDLVNLMDKPMAFFGHSVGAVVAFEVAEECVRRGGAAPALLLASGHCAPHVHDGERYGHMHKLSDQALAAELRKWGALPAAVLDQPEMLALVLPSLRADFELTEALPARTVPASKLPIPLVALCGSSDELVAPADAADWQLHTARPETFECKVFEGGHFFIVQLMDEVLEYVSAVWLTQLARLRDDALRQMHKWNDERTRTELPCRHALVHAMCLEEPAQKWPEDLALTHRDERLTFRQLDDRASQLARFLRAEVGVGPDRIVGIFMEHCVEFAVAYYGIMKAGGAYMALNLATAPAVLEQQADNAGCACVLTTNHTAGLARQAPSLLEINMQSEWPRICAVPETLWVPPEITSENLSFCGSSSGSTGKPKAMVAPHSTAVASNFWRQERFPLVKGDNVANHIFLTWELTHPHYAGCPMHLVDDDAIYDPEKLLRFLAEVKCTQVLFTPSLIQNILESATAAQLAAGMKHMKQLLLCGEVVNWKLVHRLEAVNSNLRIFSEYSIAEIGTVTMGMITEPPAGHKRATCPVGWPDPHVKCWILDEDLRPVPLGSCGELYVGGSGLGRKACYLNQPELTKERYMQNVFSEAREAGIDERMFRTGDGARFLPDGQIELVGRVAFMVKLRGYSIVPSAVESALNQHPGVHSSVVAVKGSDGAEQLVGYYVPNSQAQHHNMDTAAMRAFLQDKVASFELPSAFVQLSEFPLGLTGKIDMKQLPEPPAPLKPKMNKSASGLSLQDGLLTATEKLVLKSWESVLAEGSVSMTMLDTSFFDLGGHSLMVAKVCKLINQEKRVDLLPTDLFLHPTIRQLASRVDEMARKGSQVASAHSSRGGNLPRCKSTPAVSDVPESLPSIPESRGGWRGAVACVGLSCRFPGASDPEEFFRKLREGVECIRFRTLAELDARGVPEEASRAPNYVPASALLEDVFHFDAELFGMSRMEACVVDPQHRQLLVGAWEAAESSGYLNDPQDGSCTAYYCGVAMATYYHNMLADFLSVGAQNERALMIEVGTDKDYAAHRVSFHLNLTGPSVCVQTSCSTALSCVALACADLHNGSSDRALAGAASILFPQAVGYLYHEGMPESRTGHCCTFDAEACGTMFGDATGTVMLRPSAPADAADQSEVDTVLAYIAGYGINNDGHQKSSFNAPSVPGQKACIVRALRAAAASPLDISFVECHGTGTVLGDPIEVAALREAFESRGQERDVGEAWACALGALKPNFAHSNIAAGMGGVVKMLQAMRAAELPGQINFTKLNPHIPLASSGFTIQRELAPWDVRGAGLSRMGGMTCLGMGGTNVHVILREAGETAAPRAAASELSQRLVVVSGHTRGALVDQCNRLRSFLKSKHASTLALKDVAFTLSHGRRHFPTHRVAVVCDTLDELDASLARQVADPAVPDASSLGERAARPDKPTVTLLLPGQVDARWTLTEPSTVAAIRALAGSEPSFQLAMKECVALIQTHTDACPETLAALCTGKAEGGALPQMEPGQSDLVLFCIEFSLGKFVESLGLVPALLVAQGVGEWAAGVLAGVLPLEAAIQCLAACRSSTERVAELIQATLLGNPKYRILSEQSQGVLPDSVARDAAHWAACYEANLRPSCSWQLPSLDGLGASVFVECGGCGTTPLNSFVRQLQSSNAQSAPTVCSLLGELPISASSTTDPPPYLLAIGRLYAAGADVDLGPRQRAGGAKRVPLPTHAFQEREFGPDQLRKQLLGRTQTSGVSERRSPADIKPKAKVKEERLTPVAAWMSVPSFSRAGRLPRAGMEDVLLRRVLVLGGTGSTTEAALSQELARKGHQIWTVMQGGHLATHMEGRLFTVRGGEHMSSDLEWVFAQLANADSLPHQLVHCWSLQGGEPEEVAVDGWSAFVGISKAVSGELSVSSYYSSHQKLDVRLITEDMFSVNGEPTNPHTAVLLGALIVLPQENPSLRTQVIDVRPTAGVYASLVSELDCSPAPEDKLLALRWPVCVRGGTRKARSGAGNLKRQPFRWRLVYQPQPSTPLCHAAGVRALRAGVGQVFLITGGLGRIGLSLARSLLQFVPDSRVVITTRAAMPPQSQWDAIVSQAGDACAPAAEGSVKRVQLIHELWKEFGERIAVCGEVQVDSVVHMRECLELVTETHGRVVGVLHLAGLADLRYVPEAGVETLHKELEPKMRGVKVLEEVLEDHADCEFVVLFSSMAAILGGYGMVAYSAANCYMDAFAGEKNAETRESGEGGTIWKSVNWDDWAFEYGKEQTAAYALTGTAAYAITPEEGFEALTYILGREDHQVLVSPRSIAPRAGQWLYGKKSADAPDHKQSNTEGGDGDAPVLKGSMLHADVESLFLIQFQKITMEESMSAATSFFDVGGDSLMAAELLATLKANAPAQLICHLSISALITHPSAQALTTHLLKVAGDADLPKTDDDVSAQSMDVDLTQILLAEFRRVLMEDAIGPFNNFFDVGGDSLMAAELLVGLKAALPAGSDSLRRLNLRAVFDHPTAKGLAGHLSAETSA